MNGDMPLPTISLPGQKTGFDIGSEVIRRSGVDFNVRFHCRCCASGCPFVEAMDDHPHGGGAIDEPVDNSEPRFLALPNFRLNRPVMPRNDCFGDENLLISALGFFQPTAGGQAADFRPAAPGWPPSPRRSLISVRREGAAALIQKWSRVRFFSNGKEKPMNMTYVSTALVLATLVFANIALADAPLSGTVGRITIDDTVEIRRNSSATLNGTIIQGNVLVRSGATLISNGAKIDGNVQAFDAYLVDLRQ